VLELIEVLTIIAGVFALYFKFRSARALRRLTALIEQQKALDSEKAPVPSVAGPQDHDAG